jgi:hypothetical protein
MNFIIRAIISITINPVIWFCRIFLKWNRLEKIDTVSLLSPINDAIDLYGDDFQKEKHAEFPESAIYSFEVGLFHEATITEWNGKIHEVTYWSSHPNPKRDLIFMMERYGEQKKWRTLTDGYLYLREDDACALWCSAAPAIGVGTASFRDAKKTSKQNKV